MHFPYQHCIGFHCWNLESNCNLFNNFGGTSSFQLRLEGMLPIEANIKHLEERCTSTSALHWVRCCWAAHWLAEMWNAGEIAHFIWVILPHTLYLSNITPHFIWVILNCPHTNRSLWSVYFHPSYSHLLKWLASRIPIHPTILQYKWKFRRFVPK